MSDQHRQTGPIRRDNETWMTTCWHTEDMCPHCDNAVLATNGRLTWCEFCGYSRKPCGAPLDDDEAEYNGEGLA